MNTLTKRLLWICLLYTSTLCKLVLRDESPYYIKENIFDNIHFYPDYFSMLSERDGYSHLYWYSTVSYTHLDVYKRQILNKSPDTF